MAQNDSLSFGFACAFGLVIVDSGCCFAVLCIWVNITKYRGVLQCS